MSASLTARVEQLERRLARVEGTSAEGIEPPVRRIVRQVALHYGLSEVQLLGEERAAHVALARHMAMSLCRHLNGHSFPRIGRVFGRRDHTTVQHAVRRIEKLKAEDPGLAATWDALAETIMAHHPETEA